MVRNCCIAWFLYSFINALCSMVLTSTEQFPLSLLFAVQSKLHLFVLTYHCQVLCCLDYRWILGCRASSRTTMTPRAAVGPQKAAGLGVNLGLMLQNSTRSL